MNDLSLVPEKQEYFQKFDLHELIHCKVRVLPSAAGYMIAGGYCWLMTNLSFSWWCVVGGVIGLIFFPFTKQT